MNTIRAVIVEDEPLGLELLETKLRENCPHVEIIGSFSTAAKAMQGIQALKPHLVFIDIGLDTITGLEIFERLHHLRFEAIFVTTSRELPDSIEALRLGAVDYLSKPFTDEELIDAVNRAYPRIMNKVTYLHIVSRDREQFIPVADIITCKASSNYTEVSYKSGNKTKSILASETLKSIDERLPPDRFFRIHRSFTISRDHIVGINRTDGLRASMSDGQELDISRDKRGDFYRWMGLNES
jgi:two-component system LytT family response regulator